MPLILRTRELRRKETEKTRSDTKSRPKESE
jgi:hypothetical protein